jgi:hypothetical protein
MKRLIFFLVCTLPAALIAQETTQSVIGSAGDDYQSDKVQISWTIGEVATETLSSENYILSQGFHQGNLKVNTLMKDLPADFQIKAYPNPVKDILIIESLEPGFEYQLMDANGRVIRNGIINANSEEIDFSSLSPGTYFLQTGKKRTHKIIKN